MIDEHDPHVNALGIKGVGEIGITGSAGAVANAVWHATGNPGASFPDQDRRSRNACSKLDNDERFAGDPKRSAGTQMPLNYGFVGAQPALFCSLDRRT